VREQIEQRLTALRGEHETGVRMMAELEARRTELQQTLLRIGGAMQVLEELLDAGAGEPEDGRAETFPLAGSAAR
jgi:hypothetical protein